VAADIRGRGQHAVAVRCDVAQKADVEAAVATAIAEYGGLDCMIHNAVAPVGEPMHVEHVPAATWQAMMDTAVRASFYCAQAAYDQLVQRQGTMIFLTSAAGVEGSPYVPAYSVVKAAQRGLAKSLAREWGPVGIRVNSIGPVAMTPAMEKVAKVSPVFLEGRLIGRTPLRRIGEPEPDIGPVAVFLASDLSAYVTGQTIMVDGGGFMAF
jgi:NAD(P)-dependent dehydrogenase (short-subunit alcohol dehydrogenase family)